MDKLIKMLDDVYYLRDLDIYRGEKGKDNWIDIEHPHIVKIIREAKDVIFTVRGYVNLDGIKAFKEAGKVDGEDTYTVIPVEVDPGFGWLTAGIVLPELGIIAVHNSNLDNRWRRK